MTIQDESNMIFGMHSPALMKSHVNTLTVNTRGTANKLKEEMQTPRNQIQGQQNAENSHFSLIEASVLAACGAFIPVC